MRKNLQAILFLSLPLTLWASEVQIAVNPNPIFVGESGQFEIVSTSGKPEIRSFPKITGVQWKKNAPFTSVQIINFDRIDKLTYQFVAQKAGKVVIPPVEIYTGNKVHKSDPITLTIKERRIGNASNSLTLDDLVFLKVSFDEKDSPPETIYLGQEIAVTIKLYVDHRLEIYSDKFNQTNSFTNPANYFPQMRLTNTIFQDYSEQNKFNNKFLYEDRKTEILEDRRFHVFTYFSRISGIEIGTIEGFIEHTIPFIDRKRQKTRSRNSRDDFFGFDDFFSFSGFSRRNQVFTHKVEFTVASIAVISLPENSDPEGHFLGIIGNWKSQCTVDRSLVSVGEDVSLILELKGKGNMATLTAPELDLPGFRVYPPEITRETGSESLGIIKWVVIPLNAGSQLPGLRFTTFDPEMNRFDLHEFQPLLSVREQEKQSSSGPIVEDYGSESSKRTSKARDLHRASDILYIKKTLGNNVKVPLWKNAQTPFIFLGASGPVIYFSLLLIMLRREKLQGNTSYRRRREAIRNRNRILKSIKTSNSDDLPTIVREELIPYLIAIFNLPPGATVSDLLDKINDPDLEECLKQAEQGEYMPGNSSKLDPKILLHKIKQFTLILFFFYLPYIGWCEKPFQDAALLYDQGKLGEAEKIYHEILASGENNNPSILFNLGNCAYRKGEYGSAIAYYERARRLSPRDSDIYENLNFVRSQLNLPSIQPHDTPLQLLRSFRDHWRPDEWLLCAGIAWFSFWMILSVNRIMNVSSKSLLFLSGLILAIAVLAHFTQLSGTYARNQGVILSQNTPLYRLPVSGGEEKAKTVLNTGDYVSIVEQRSEWNRVRIDQEEGWVKKNAFEIIW